MALIEINRNPSTRELKWFGLLLPAFAALLSLVLWRGYGLVAAPRVVLAAAVIVAVVYSALPPIRKPVYIGWMYAAMPIGAVVSVVLLAVVYFLVVTPVGLLVRLFSHDPMTRRFDRAAPTYWAQRERTPEAGQSDRYFKQF